MASNKIPLNRRRGITRNELHTALFYGDKDNIIEILDIVYNILISSGSIQRSQLLDVFIDLFNTAVFKGDGLIVKSVTSHVVWERINILLHQELN